MDEDDGRDWWACADNRVERLRKLLELKAPGHIVRKEIELVQAAVDRLYPTSAEGGNTH